MPELVALDLPAGPAFVDALVDRLGRPATPCSRSTDGFLLRPSAPLVEAMAPTGRVVDAEGSHRRPAGRPTEPGDALVVPTSGTTGEPKGVVLTHAAVAGLGRWPPRTGWRSTRPPTAGWPACPWPTSGGCRWSPGPWSPAPPHRVRTVRPGRGRAPGAIGGHPGVAGGHRPPAHRRLRLPPGPAGRGRPARGSPAQCGHHLRDDRDRLGGRLRREAPRRRRGPHRRRHPRGRGRGAGPRPDAAARPTGTGRTRPCPGVGCPPATADGSRPTGP